jgi:hypothetical protein
MTMQFYFTQLKETGEFGDGAAAANQVDVREVDSGVLVSPPGFFQSGVSGASSVSMELSPFLFRIRQTCPLANGN